MNKLEVMLKLAELLADDCDSAAPSTGSPYGVGESVIVRTVTHYYIGTVVRFDARWLHLKDASWVADTGRWADALTSGKLNEVEPYPNGCAISVGAIVDVSPWTQAVPRTQK